MTDYADYPPWSQWPAPPAPAAPSLSLARKLRTAAAFCLFAMLHFCVSIADLSHDLLRWYDIARPLCVRLSRGCAFAALAVQWSYFVSVWRAADSSWAAAMMPADVQITLSIGPSWYQTLLVLWQLTFAHCLWVCCAMARFFTSIAIVVRTTPIAFTFCLAAAAWDWIVFGDADALRAGEQPMSDGGAAPAPPGNQQG